MKGRVLLTVLAVAVAAAVMAAPASAVLRLGGGGAVDLGVFKVTGGHFIQEVNYSVRFRSVDGAYDDCYVMQFQDDGSATFNLSFDPDASTRIVNRTWGVSGPHTPSALSFEKPTGAPLRRSFPHLSGVASRHWTGTSEIDQGPSYDPEGCPSPPAPPAQSTTGCGSQNLTSWGTGLELLAVGGGALDLAPTGPVLEPTPFDSCPSDSVYGTTAAPAKSSVGKAELRDADPGETVRLSGRKDWTHSGEEGFFVPFQFISGEQHLRQDWELQLVKVQCGILGCDDDQARFRGPPDRVERKMKRAAKRLKGLLELERPSLRVFATEGIAFRARQAGRGAAAGHRRHRLRLGLVCGRREVGKRQEVGGIFLTPHRHDWEPVANSGALEEARVGCVEAAAKG